MMFLNLYKDRLAPTVLQAITRHVEEHKAKAGAVDGGAQQSGTQADATSGGNNDGLGASQGGVPVPGDGGQFSGLNMGGVNANL